MKASDWISVDAELPETDGEMLVSCDDKETKWVQTAIYTPMNAGCRWVSRDGVNLPHVTHWMPIVHPNNE